MTRRTQEEVYGYDRFKLLVLLLLLAGLVLVAFYGDRLGLTDSGLAAVEPTADLISVAPTVEPLPTQSGQAATAIPTVEPTAEAEPTEEATQAPAETVLVSPAPGSELPSGPVTFSGTGEPGTVVQVLSNGVVVAGGMVDEAGNWSAPASLPAGSPAINLQTLDAEGNVLAETTPTTLTLTGAPVPGVNLPTTEVVAGPVVLTGSGEPGATVNVWLNGQPAGLATVGPDGQWQVPADLGGGDYILQVQTLDANGAVVAESNPVTITIVGPPAATSVAEAPATPVSTATVEPSPEPSPTPVPTATVAPTQEPTPVPTAVPTAVPTTPPTTEEGDTTTGGSFDPLVGGPTLLGNTDPGNIVQMLANGSVVETTSPDAAGAWAIPVAVDLLDSLIQVRTLNNAGLVVSTTQPIPPADIPVMPSFAAFPDPPAVAAGAVTWTGSGRPGTGVEVVIDGEVAAVATVDAGGAWTAETVLEPGDYALSLNALDVGGTVIAASDSIDLSVESSEGGIDGPAEGAGSIVDVAESAGLFRTLLAAAEAAGLAETLDEGGPFTVFAPTDEAFARLPVGAIDVLLETPDVLGGLLKYHVVPDVLTAADLATVEELGTAAMFDDVPLPLAVAVDGETIRVGGATVAAADIPATNGVIHVVDRVLVPAPIGAQPVKIDDSGVETFVGPALTVVGTAEPGTVVRLTINDTEFGAATVGPDGRWLIAGNVGTGEHVLVAYMFDAGGLLQGASQPLDLFAR